MFPQAIALSQMDVYRKDLLRASKDKVDEVMFNKVALPQLPGTSIIIDRASLAVLSSTDVMRCRGTCWLPADSMSQKQALKSAKGLLCHTNHLKSRNAALCVRAGH